MSMNIDKPLDDVIAEKRKSRAPRRPRGPRNAAPGNAPAAAPAQAAGGRAPRHAASNAVAAAVPAQAHVGDKIIVSNLPTDVDERQIKELFATTVGPVRSVSLAYNAQGQSKGIATVLFQKAQHATSAYQQYNKRLIDGTKPIRVEVIVDPSRVAAAAHAAQPLTARLGAAPPVKSRAAQSATVSAAGGSATQGGSARRGGRGAGAGAGAGGRRGAGRGARAPERPKATVESLDAEMSDWQAQVSASAPAAAPAAAE